MAKLKTTLAGWQITKTNKLKAPEYEKRPAEWHRGDRLEHLFTQNVHFEPLAEAGDFVYVGHNGIHANTVGRIIEVHFNYSVKAGHYCKVETLDGEIKQEWLYWCFKITPEMLQEVKDFYIVNNKPEKIKVNW